MTKVEETLLHACRSICFFHSNGNCCEITVRLSHRDFCVALPSISWVLYFEGSAVDTQSWLIVKLWPVENAGCHRSRRNFLQSGLGSFPAQHLQHTFSTARVQGAVWDTCQKVDHRRWPARWPSRLQTEYSPFTAWVTFWLSNKVEGWRRTVVQGAQNYTCESGCQTTTSW